MPNQWRGRVQLLAPSSVRARLGTLSLGVVGLFASVAIGAALAAASAAVLYAFNLRAARLNAILFLAPILLWGGWLRTRKQHSLDASPRMEVDAAAGPGRLTLNDKVLHVTRARFERGLLTLYGPLLVSSITLEMEPLIAAELVEALSVPDTGLRTIRLQGPFLSLPIVGPILVIGGPLMALFGALALGNAIDLSTQVIFGVLLLVGVAATILVCTRRVLVVGQRAVATRWLWSIRTWPVHEIQGDWSSDGTRLLLTPRGQKTISYRVMGSYLTTTTTMGEWRREAREQAALALELLRARRMAAIFE